MAAHRHTVRIPLKAGDYPILSRITADPSFRVMVFCAADGVGPQDIAFPHQSEIKVNHGEIKANLRGLKNKPGSTRPVDITKELRLNAPTHNNEIEMTYALTNKGSNESQVSCRTPNPLPALYLSLLPSCAALSQTRFANRNNRSSSYFFTL